MRRIIEELVEKRKKKQANLKKTLDTFGCLIEKRRHPISLFSSSQSQELKDTLSQLNEDLNELITIQDKEWDAYSNNHSTMVFKSLEWKIGKLEAEYANVKSLLTHFISLEKTLSGLISAIDAKTGEVSDSTDLTDKLKEVKDQLSVYQYSDFEQRFRGDTEKVKAKLKGYLPIFESCDNILDMGCGRGEFMELLQEQGKKVSGIDVSESMLRVAHEKGLNATMADALTHLQQLPDQSIGGLFSAQVIEHLQPEYLREVVLEAHRVLAPGAPVVLETVNPLSLFALSNIYFLDVTHQKPLHPEFMRYLIEGSGFNDVNIIYPEELTDEQLEGVSPENLMAREFNSNVDKLNKLLYASPVYAVVGKK
jgi:O-antigen chain-terminating methyltransferase